MASLRESRRFVQPSMRSPFFAAFRIVILAVVLAAGVAAAQGLASSLVHVVSVSASGAPAMACNGGLSGPC